jgi:DNA-binding response OmpR family regulator
VTGEIQIAQLQARGLRFDARVRTIDVAGRKTVLDSRSCSIFFALAERFGECLTKEELLRAAWPGQLVHENSLAKAISKLRRAIAGSAIEIVASYGLGYVMQEAATDADRAVDVWAAEKLTTATGPAGHKRPIAIVVLLTLSVLLIAAAGMLTFTRSRSPIESREVPLITHDAPNAVATILWVDDHPSNNRPQVAALKQDRIAVHLAETTEDALKLLAMNRYDLLISDLGRGEDRLAGLKMIKAIRQRGNTVPVVIYTVRPKDRAGQVAQRQLAAEAGAADLVVTPQEVRAQVRKRLAASSTVTAFHFY